MERVLLYYPTINIPDQYWLRNALLYSDKVGSIIPWDSMNHRKISNDMRLLYDEGQYMPFAAFGNWESASGIADFEKSVLDTLRSDKFEQLLASPPSLIPNVYGQAMDNYHMYITKLTRRVREYLHMRGWLSDIDETEGMVNAYVAALYMGQLAAHFANTAHNVVIPSTDESFFETLAFKLSDNTKPAGHLHLQNCLPVPSGGKTLKQLIRFKQKRRQELLQFRLVIERYQQKLTACTSVKEVTEVLMQFKEEFERESTEIKSILKDSKIEFVLSGFSALLDFEKPKVLTTLAGAGTGLAAVLGAAAPVIAGLGVLTVGTSVVSALRANRNEAKKNPFSYLFHAQQAGLVV